MDGTRLYDDQEVAEIFKRATSERDALPVAPTSTGLTLRELEEIGAEVGVHPERIAEAARSIERVEDPSAVERYLGAPRSVSHRVPIDRALTEDEWGRLVADLRRTFKAKGRVESLGSLRTWSNGNLQVHVEPDGHQYAVRMTTRKGNATQLTMMGTAFSVVGVLSAIGATGDAALAGPATFLALGLGTIAWVRASLPGWARNRKQQMEDLARRIPLLLE